MVKVTHSMKMLSNLHIGCYKDPVLHEFTFLTQQFAFAFG